MIQRISLQPDNVNLGTVRVLHRQPRSFNARTTGKLCREGLSTRGLGRLVAPRDSPFYCDSRRYCWTSTLKPSCIACPVHITSERLSATSFTGCSFEQKPSFSMEQRSLLLETRMRALRHTLRGSSRSLLWFDFAGKPVARASESKLICPLAAHRIGVLGLFKIELDVRDFNVEHVQHKHHCDL